MNPSGRVHTEWYCLVHPGREFLWPLTGPLNAVCALSLKARSLGDGQTGSEPCLAKADDDLHEWLAKMQTYAWNAVLDPTAGP